MKFMVLLLAVLAGVWLWRRGRARRQGGQPLRGVHVAPPQWLVPCAHCGVQLPASDAVAGRRGRYCCAQHRRESEGV